MDIITRNLNITELDNIFIGTTDYESTSHVILTGRNFVHLTHSPNKVFDKLPETFDKLKLICLIVGLSVIFIGTHFYAKNKRKYKNYNTD